MSNAMRTHDAGILDASFEGKAVRVAGWVHSRRDHGGVYFFNVRDRSGLLQVVVHPEKAEAFLTAAKLGAEFVVSISGTIQRRPKGAENPKLPTGEVELNADTVTVLNTCKVLPFEVDEHITVNEESRLKYRFLDLRRPRMAANLVLRSRLSQVVRNYLYNLGFNEVETPLLTRSTPEGARDFVVPSRNNPGEFYALPQSPQQFKQVLMMSGMDRYFQLARNFRDEELRSDRQPEHTQIDLEMSFVDEVDVARVVEGMMKDIFAFVGDEVSGPFPEMEFSDVMLKYGSDKPDLRYALEIRDCSDIFKASEFKVFSGAMADGGVVRAIKGEGAAVFSRGDMDKLTELVKKLGAKGLVWLRFKDGKWESPTLKFITDAEQAALKERLEVRDGDAVFIAADKAAVAAPCLGGLRNELIARLKPAKLRKLAFLWVRHFPLLEKDAESGAWTFTHNPFTAPLPEEAHKLDTDPGNIRSAQYDLVLNGVELGSGSVRNHSRAMQEKIFALMGYDKEQVQARFGMIVNAMDFGAPPHGGIGIGYDRLIGIICGTDSIRDVIAFPKTTSGACLMSEAPSVIDDKQLKELHLKITD